MRLRVLIPALLLLCTACEDKPKGRRLASGIAQRLTVAGGAVAFLLDARRPDDRGVPDDLLLGDLYTARLDGEAVKAGSGVSNAPGAFAFSKDGGAVAFLSGYRFREGTGELRAARPGAASSVVAKVASTFSWSPAGEVLAYVSPAGLGLWREGASRTVPIEGVQSFAWSPDGRRVAARAAAAAGGKLYLVDAETGASREVAQATTDFAFSPDGALAVLGPPPPKGGDRPLLLATDGAPAKTIGKATSIAFSPTGAELALFSTARQPGDPIGDLSRLPRGGTAPAGVGERVSDFRYAKDGTLVFLAKYELRSRSGALTVAAQGQAPRELAPKVQSFLVEGARLFWLVPVAKKDDFRIELWTASLPAGEPRRVDEGVYGWQLAQDGKSLYYKARCAGGPRSCSLFRLDLDAATAPALLASDVAGFELSGDASRVLLERPHRGAVRAVDLASLGTSASAREEPKPFALEADAGPRLAGRSVLYATVTAGKGGVFVAELP